VTSQVSTRDSQGSEIAGGPWNLGFIPLQISYNTSNNSVSFKNNNGAWVSRSDLYANSSTVYPYWGNLASVKGANLESWDSPQKAIDAVATFQVYDSAKFAIAPIGRKEYPAFPFDITLSTVEDASGQTPRGLLKITYRDNPNYYGILFLFPGAGDMDFSNRPLLIGDAFDPEVRRDAFATYFADKYRALLDISREGPRKLGYDVYFLDFSQGGGNLHINSMIYLKAMEWLSGRTKGSLVTGGVSMGGILARLALLYSLPENNARHLDLARKVKGYLSIDSPHQGANIAGSVLRAIYSLLDDGMVLAFGPKGDLRDYRNQLNSPAAHQLLFEHYYLSSGASSTAAHDAFFQFLASKGGYRRDIPKIAIAYSNFYKPHPNWYGPYDHQIAAIGKDAIYRDIRGNTQEFVPGSTGDWYYSPFMGTRGDNIHFVADPGTPKEAYKGTFIPIQSALDLKSFDVFNPPSVQERDIRTYSPFDAVYYMHDTYSGYCTAAGSCSRLSLYDPSTGLGSRTSIDDKRYEHVIFDNQLMQAINSSLRTLDSFKTRRSVISPKLVLLK
jgi:hypothetical protein